MAKQQGTAPISQEEKAFFKKLLENYQNPRELLGENGIMQRLKKGLIEAAMQSEMTEHLGYEKHSPEGFNSKNSRNGTFEKTVRTEDGPVTIEIPRDRESSFEPQIIKKGQRDFSGFDDKIIAMYARGMSVRDIQSHLQEIYGVEVSADFVSNVTDSVIKELEEWQNRSLDSVYPVVYLDALHLKIRDAGQVQTKAVYLAVGINIEGRKELLGMWIEKTEGAKFWLRVVTELKNRGVNDILIACVDGLKGFPEAIRSVFPKTEIQLCIVHMVRNSLKFVSWKNRKEIADDLKKIYSSVNTEAAEKELERFSDKWDNQFPTISKSWRNNWNELTAFFEYSKEIRKAIYTTNAIESTNFSLRKITKQRGSFPSDESALKLLYLGVRNIEKRWTLPIRNWSEAISQFSIKFGERIQL